MRWLGVKGEQFDRGEKSRILQNIKMLQGCFSTIFSSLYLFFVSFRISPFSSISVLHQTVSSPLDIFHELSLILLHNRDNIYASVLRKIFTFPCGCHSIFVSADFLGSFVPQLLWRRFLFFLRFFCVPFLSDSWLFLTADRWKTTCGWPLLDILWFFDGSMRYSFLLVRM